MSFRPLKIVLLEDNPDHTELIEAALKAKDEQFEIDSCTTRIEFFALLGQTEYDALLIDYHFGDGHGLEILAELLEKKNKAPIIFISGTDDDQIITQVMEGGASDFIVKSRSSLKTLPIIVKRNIIRKMAIQKRQESLAESVLPSQLAKRLDHSIQKISKVSTKLTNSLRNGQAADDDMHLLENLLEKTSALIKSAKNSFFS